MKVLVDYKQVAHTALLLIEFCPTYKGANPHAVVEFLADEVQKAVDFSMAEDDTAIVTHDGFTIVVITAASEVSGSFPEGYSHAVQLLVNPTAIVNATEQESCSCDHGCGNDTKYRDIDESAVRYIHLRRYNDLKVNGYTVDSELMSRGGRTIAFVDNGDGTLTYAVARCHKNDTYVKKQGNAIARDRLRYSDTSVTIQSTINEFRIAIDDGMVDVG